MQAAVLGTDRDLLAPGPNPARQVIDFGKTFPGQKLRSDPAAPADRSVNNRRLVGNKFSEAVVEFAKGDEFCPRQMPVVIFARLANIEKNNIALISLEVFGNKFFRLLPGDRLDRGEKLHPFHSSPHK